MMVLIDKPNIFFLNQKKEETVEKMEKVSLGDVGLLVGLEDSGLLWIKPTGKEWDSRWLEMGRGLEN